MRGLRWEVLVRKEEVRVVWASVGLLTLNFDGGRRKPGTQTKLNKKTKVKCI